MTLGKRKICSTIKKYQNNMNMIVCIFLLLLLLLLLFFIYLFFFLLFMSLTDLIVDNNHILAEIYIISLKNRPRSNVKSFQYQNLNKLKLQLIQLRYPYRYWSTFANELTGCNMVWALWVPIKLEITSMIINKLLSTNFKQK